MRRLAPVVAVLVAAAMPAPASAAKRTITVVRMKAPSPANATVAGFRLNLLRARKARMSVALARSAARLPKNVTVYAVVARQKRSDRVSGVLVAVNRAQAVAASAAALPAARVLTVNLRHPRVPKGYRLALSLKQTANVLSVHRGFRCSKYFRGSDLGSAVKLAGARLPNVTIGTVIQSACESARSGRPYPTEGEFRTALNARSGSLSFVRSTQVPSEVDGTASFNFSVRAFGVLADKGHQFTSCGFTAGTCAISSKAHANDYALFTVSGAPAPRDAQLAFALAVAPQVTPALPFQFFGMTAADSRFGPLLTSGP
jgi:hypothetical protein